MFPHMLQSIAVLAVAALSTSAIAQPLRPPPENQEAGRPAAPAPAPAPQREPGYLGFMGDDRREQGQGVRVVRVVERSPAAEAGIEVDDLITSIEGKRVGSINDMAAQLQPLEPDNKVRFEVRRGDTAKTIEVTLGRRPPRGEREFEFGRIPERLPEPANGQVWPGDARPQPPGTPPPVDVAGPSVMRRQLLGIRTATVSEEVRRRLRLPEAAGALVISRVVGSPADKSGLPLDAVIVAADGQPVTSPADLARSVAAAGAGKDVELTYYSGGEQKKTVVTLADVVGSPPAGDAAPRLDDGRVVPRPLDPLVPPPDNAAERIEQLERRIRELEQRVQELERALKR